MKLIISLHFLLTIYYVTVVPLKTNHAGLEILIYISVDTVFSHIMQKNNVFGYQMEEDLGNNGDGKNT